MRGRSVPPVLSPAGEARPSAGWPLSAAAAFYPAWLVYGGLFPLAGWRDSGLSPLVFLAAGLPRYWTAFDLAANLVLYVPLGFVWARWLAFRARAPFALAGATLLAALLSVSVEVLQNWLPSRVPSNLDLLCNAAGALIGALLARRYDAAWAPRAGAAWRRHVRPNPGAEAGAILLVLWALTQLSPDGILFSSGLARSEGSAWLPLAAPERRLHLEAIAVAAHTAVVGLLACQLLNGPVFETATRIVLGALLVLSAKAVFAGLGVGFAKAFEWLTPGAQWGLLAGAAGLLALSPWSSRFRIAAMLAALAAGSAALLMLPASPYSPGAAIELRTSPVRNAVGALNTLALIWPVALAAYLIWQLLPKRAAGHDGTPGIQ